MKKLSLTEATCLALEGKLTEDGDKYLKPVYKTEIDKLANKLDKEVKVAKRCDILGGYDNKNDAYYIEIPINEYKEAVAIIENMGYTSELIWNTADKFWSKSLNNSIRDRITFRITMHYDNGDFIGYYVTIEN